MAKRTAHQHKFILYKDLPLYECGRCREYGANCGYKCNKIDNSNCRFVLHKVCAKRSNVLSAPVFSRAKFDFQENCDHKMYSCTACERPIKGGFYRERNRPHMRLHPLCIRLPSRLNSPAHSHRLSLVSARGIYTCGCCKKWRNRVWRYQCKESACKFVVDLQCAKREIHGIPMSE
ncbi:hypothetical protein SUGI_1128590 [Cryptomeria japonica]|uniref:uncharacterized protein LOC131860078 n=1 Tax=Cryptomeria japonica TaxID=3369 RepID=UPI002414A1C6|nr:uncharacterized protein LOC131860078 [Cryptomeria japonica]GLJ52988.1 hypothetical protein SUGI_1128590 [Cryptomeria japonica]